MDGVTRPQDKSGLAIRVLTLPGSGNVVAIATTSRLSIEVDVALEPLGIVLETAVAQGHDVFRRSIRQAAGRSFEGVVSYAFNDEVPDEVPKGQVVVDFLNESAFLSTQDFEAAAEAAMSGRGTFTPKWGVDVFDIVGDRAKSPVLIGKAYSDGKHGALLVREASFRPLLRELFCEPLHRRIGTGGVDHAGIRMDPALQRLTPWRQETLAAIVAEALLPHRLQGALRSFE